ncbi:MAG TPA: peptide chain release factor N(5)-glutamine methyltransferase [Planococcus sp. (in: firmicutes)]|nr:peptide chain release factor N(5)-glutamine methyltransferase [Planococcus sp. (in: firmicutes)]
MNDSIRVHEALNRASSFLKDHHREEAVARILLQHELGMSQALLLASLRDPVSAADFDRFWQKVELHAKGTPVQHLTGKEEFYGREFLVNPTVLIPRPETEELVEETLKLINTHLAKENPAIADIGTGSGIIAITMKCELPHSDVTATDISESALTTAAVNAERLGADVTFLHGDLTEPIRGAKWDVVLSNPPYIAHSEAKDLSDTVHDHEPHEALFAAGNGLAIYAKLAEQLPPLVNKPGIIGFEIGHQQGEAVKGMLTASFPQAAVYVKKDINKRDRMVFCIIT